jgi:hypothetical protein
MNPRRLIVVGAAAVAVSAPLLLAAARWPQWWTQIAPEQSAMTWLQSTVLALAAGACALASVLLRDRLWLLLAAGFLVLTLDERFAIHERIRDQILAPHHVSVPFLPWIAPGDFLLLLYAVAALLLMPKFWRLFNRDSWSMRLLVLGGVLAAAAVGFDSINPADWTVVQERYEQSLEECCELATDLFVLAAIVLRLIAPETHEPHRQDRPEHPALEKIG